MDSFGVDVHTQYIMPHMHTTHKCKYHNVHVHTDTHTYRNAWYIEGAQCITVQYWIRKDEWLGYKKVIGKASEHEHTN